MGWVPVGRISAPRGAALLNRGTLTGLCVAPSTNVFRQGELPYKGVYIPSVRARTVERKYTIGFGAGL